MFRLTAEQQAAETTERRQALRQLAERAGPREITVRGDVLRDALDDALQAKPPRKAKPTA